MKNHSLLFIRPFLTFLLRVVPAFFTAFIFPLYCGTDRPGALKRVGLAGVRVETSVGTLMHTVPLVPPYNAGAKPHCVSDGINNVQIVEII